MKVTKRTFLALFALAVCVLFYQNCSTTSGLHQNLREVSLASNLSIDVLDQSGSPFLTWDFKAGSEMFVSIAPAKKRFCDRSFILKKSYESLWSALIRSLSQKEKRGVASKGARQIFKVNYDGQAMNVTHKDARKIFTLMEKTKLNHNLEVSNCGKKNWGFKKVTIEGLTTTKNNSKYLQVVKVNVLGGNAALTKIEEEPIEVAMNAKDMFCDYTFREYDPNSALLSVMYAANELNSINLNNGRGLASVTTKNESGVESTQPSYLITVDNGEKFITPKSSELVHKVQNLVHNIKASRKTRKSCAYTY